MSDARWAILEGLRRFFVTDIDGKTIAKSDLNLCAELYVRFTDGTFTVIGSYCVPECNPEITFMTKFASWDIAALEAVGVVEEETEARLKAIEDEESRKKSELYDRAAYERLKAKFEGGAA